MMKPEIRAPNGDSVVAVNAREEEIERKKPLVKPSVERREKLPAVTGFSF